MRYTRNKLQKLRAGQMVWRVLFWVSDNGETQTLAHSITPTWLVGKKVLHWFRHHDTGALQWSAMRMELPNCEVWKYRSGMSTARFLDDLQGNGAFSSRRHAERFVEEVYAGLHPEVVEKEFERHEMDMMFESYRDDYNDDDLIPDEGDEHWRRDSVDSGEHGHLMDQCWNESEGQGA